MKRLGHGDKALIQEPVFSRLAEKYGKSNAQIILRWHIQAGNVVIPGSKNPDHTRANFDLFDFSLSDGEMAEITTLNKDKRYYTSTPELLERYVTMVPPVDEQKYGGNHYGICNLIKRSKNVDPWIRRLPGNKG